MADINEVNGAFGGVEFGNNQGENLGANVYNPYGFGGTENTVGGQFYGNTEEATNYDRGFNYGGSDVEENAAGIGTNLPVKSGFWNKVKAFCFTEISVKLTPHQQKIENEINDFFNKEITWTSVKNFFGFGKKNK